MKTGVLGSAIALLCLVAAIPALAGDAEAEAEITGLIDAVGDSGCAFIRNGKRHTADEARSHLSMKYRRARRHAGTAELFIDRLASRSSMSGKPYYMECDGEDRQQAGRWLHRRLTSMRGG